MGPDALRKRIPTGQVRARKRAGRWQVWVSAADLDIRIVPDQPDVPDPPTPDNPDAPDVPEHQEAAQTANLAQRAEDMAVYSHRLLEPYVAQIAAQAERVGRLELELEQARARVAELELVAVDAGAAEHEDAPPAESRPGRSWWQRLWGLN